MHSEDESTPSRNYLTEENGVVITSCTSGSDGTARNVLNSNQRQVWLSKHGLPQSITLNLSGMRKRPAVFQSFGWHCWHAYSSNPRRVQLYTSEDGVSYTKWATVYGENAQGDQFFDIDSIPGDIGYLCFEIVDTFGAAKTYVNQLYLYDSLQGNRRGSGQENTRQSETSPSPILDSRYPTPIVGNQPAAVPKPSSEDINDSVDAGQLKQQLSLQLSSMADEINEIQLDQIGNSTFQPMHLPTEPTLPCRTLNFSTSTPKAASHENSSFLSEIPLRDAIVQETHELDGLKTQVRTLERSVHEVQAAVEKLTQKIGRLRSAKTQKLERFKEGILADLDRSGESVPATDNWERNMEQWQQRVLEPQLQNLSRSLEQKISQLKPNQPTTAPSKQNVAEIMAQLHAKLSEKASKLEQLEIEHSRTQTMSKQSRSPSHSETSSDYARY